VHVNQADSCDERSAGSKRSENRAPADRVRRRRRDMPRPKPYMGLMHATEQFPFIDRNGTVALTLHASNCAQFAADDTALVSARTAR